MIFQFTIFLINILSIKVGLMTFALVPVNISILVQCTFKESFYNPIKSELSVTLITIASFHYLIAHYC